MIAIILSHEAVFEQINPPIFDGMLQAYIRQAAYKPLVIEVEDIPGRILSTDCAVSGTTCRRDFGEVWGSGKRHPSQDYMGQGG